MQLAPTERTVRESATDDGIVILPQRAIGQRVFLNCTDARRLHKELGEIIASWQTKDPNHD